MLQKTIAPILLTFLTLCSSCKSKESLRTEGLKIFPDAQKIDRLFTLTHHESGYHRGIGESQSWISDGIAYDRYCIRVSFDVDVSLSGGLTKTTPARVSIIEHFDEHTKSGAKKWHSKVVGALTEGEWHKATTIDELFDLAGVVPKKHEPIPELSTCDPAYW